MAQGKTPIAKIIGKQKRMQKISAKTQSTHDVLQGIRERRSNKNYVDRGFDEGAQAQLKAGGELTPYDKKSLAGIMVGQGRDVKTLKEYATSKEKEVEQKNATLAQAQSEIDLLAPDEATRKENVKRLREEAKGINEQGNISRSQERELRKRVKEARTPEEAARLK